MPTTAKKKLTLREAAEVCGYRTTGHLRRAIAQGRLRAEKLGDWPSAPLVVTPAALDAFRRSVRPRRTRDEIEAENGVAP